MLPTTVLSVKRLAFGLFVVTLAAFRPPMVASDDHQARIQHLDGSGAATIVDVHPGVPGAANFVRVTPGPVPQPGEIIIPPSATPTWAPIPVLTPHRHGTP